MWTTLQLGQGLYYLLSSRNHSKRRTKWENRSNKHRSQHRLFAHSLNENSKRMSGRNSALSRSLGNTFKSNIDGPFQFHIRFRSMKTNTKIAVTTFELHSNAIYTIVCSMPCSSHAARQKKLRFRLKFQFINSEICS